MFIYEEQVMSKRCPNCTSENVYFSKKKGIWICEECELEFAENDCSMSVSANKNLDSAEYWAFELWEVAPTALALSYHQLHEYVKEKNIGCTLFLIRDVFELMIKIPITIIFNGIHELNKESESFSALLSSNTKVAKLYEYSMQMLSTGKWWECVRLASGLDEGVFAGDSTVEHTKLYADTIGYLKELHKKLYFKEPGKQKVSMVTWRNRTLGHSCLADNPEEKYSEIPYILEMFKTVGDIGIEYYKKVCLTDGNKNPLRGVALNRTESEVYIQYIPGEDEQASYTEIHNFIAGRDNNLSCFDGFEKGKAYLLNYGNGERYRDQHLSEWLTNRHKTLEAVTARVALSDEDVFADNLETKDINNLEEQLSAGDNIIGVSFLGRWLMDAVGSCEKGMLLLTAERGLGKSTFCSTVDPFESLEIKYDDEAYAEKLEEFLGDVAVRVWHFNSEYRSRKDIFIPGLRDALLTLYTETQNKICGRLESQYNNLVSCAEDLRSLYFTECLNNTMGEYRARTDKQKLLLILDGIDEVSNIGELCSFMPDPARLDEDVYVLLTCRTKQEIEENKKLAEFVESTQFESHLDFTRDNLTITKNSGTETNNENIEYRDVVARYIEGILREQGRTVTSEQVAELAESFEYRFSSLAAYRKLCRLSPAFNDKVGTDLFGAFIHQVEINAPETYVKRLKWILNTLVCAGEPITLRELAFLSGERYISYRLLGMMNDIHAFIKVTRSSRGNCYELSHSQWEEAVKALVPYGDIYFRKQCNELLAEMEVFFNEDNIELILEKTYEGELWLLKHILGIYNRNWKELQENWFEEIRIGSFEYLIQLFLNSFKIKNTYFNMSNIDEPYGLMKNYFSALETFGYHFEGTRGSKYEEAFSANPILLVIPQIYEHLDNTYIGTGKRYEIIEKKGDSWHLLSETTKNNVDKDSFIKKSLEAYICLLKTSKNIENIEQYGMCLYKIGRAYHLLNNYMKASEYLIKFTQIIGELSDNYDIKEYLSRSYIRIGQIQEELAATDNAIKYYIKALSLSQELVEICGTISFLDTLTYSERVISKFYEKNGDIKKAIDFRENSIATAQIVINMSHKREYENYKYNSLFHLGQLYEKEQIYEKALSTYEKAREMQEIGFFEWQEELLVSLVRVSKELCDDSKIEKYTESLDKLRELLNNQPEDILVNFLSSYAQDSKIELKESNKLDKLLEYSHHISELLLEVEKELIKRKIGELNRIHTYTTDSFCEVYSTLENLPKSITSLIPIEKLMWLKNNRGEKRVLKDDFKSPSSSDEYLALLRYVLGDLIET